MASKRHAYICQFQAKALFTEGTALEQQGQHFKAIQKYKRAVQLVPDIEFRTFDYNRKMQPKEEARGKKQCTSIRVSRIVLFAFCLFKQIYH